MQYACDLRTEYEVGTVEPLFCELDLTYDEETPSRLERLIASLGAWLGDRFSAAPGLPFIEDGRLAVQCMDLRPQADVEHPAPLPRVVH